METAYGVLLIVGGIGWIVSGLSLYFQRIRPSNLSIYILLIYATVGLIHLGLQHIIK